MCTSYDTVAIVNILSFQAMEAVLRQLNVGLVRSRPAQTLVFMLSSLVVLRQQEMRHYSGFWFIKPEQMPLDYSKWSLAHRLKQALVELCTYLGMGMAMDFFNAMMRGNIKKLQFKSTSFIVSYMAMYKVSLPAIPKSSILRFSYDFS